MEYTQQYEYAKAAVYALVRFEIAIGAKSGIDKPEGALFNICTFDITMLCEQGGYEKLMKILSTDRTYTSIVKRIKACSLEITATLGDEFVNQLRKNTIAGIINTIEDDYNLRKSYKECVNKTFECVPWLWIVPIMARAFTSNVLSFTKQNGFDMSYGMGNTGWYVPNTAPVQ